MKELLSTRGQSLSRDMPALQQAHFAIQENLYDPKARPKGYINMGTAETHLIDDEVIAFLNRVQNNLEMKPHHLHYDYFHGSREFRTAIAAYWEKLIFPDGRQKLSCENIAIGTGCTLALEYLAVMLADPDDVFLIPSPYYSSFEDDIQARALVEPVAVPCGADLSRSAFKTVLEEQKQAGKKVRAVLFASPNNPVGTVYDPEALDTLLSFCMDHDLDLIADEIYAQTIHDPQVKWVSIMSRVPDEYRHRVHVTTSFAKDFALSGFRTGFVISFNPDLLKGVHGLAYFSAVSTHTQALLTELLKTPGLEKLVETNQKQLRKSYELMAESLQNMDIPTLPAQGGIFVMANLGAFMHKPEFAEEFVLWEKIYQELKINITPGQLFKTNEPGWFRVCYAHPHRVVEEACRRIKTLTRF